MTISDMTTDHYFLSYTETTAGYTIDRNRRSVCDSHIHSDPCIL